MFSEFDRQLDKRPYQDKRNIFTGPMVFLEEAKISPYRKIVTNPQGLLEYELLPGCKAPDDEEEE